jgi:GNAT superfamily N-acetyltransferase
MRQLGYEIPSGELARRLDRVLALETHYAAVAEEGGRIVGIVHAYERHTLERPRSMVVQSIVVDRSARKTGAGKLLMIDAESWARKKGIKQAVLYTRTDRDDAHAFYEHIGYRKAATSHLMTKLLDAT